MRSAILTATFALAILAAPVPESNSIINMDEHVVEISRSAEPEPFTRKHDSYRRRDAGPEPSSLIHDGRSAEPEPFTRKHDSYRKRAPEPEPFTRSHDSYRARAPEPEPFTRSHDSYRARAPEPEPFTRSHDSYRKRAPEPEPFTRSHDSYRKRAPEPEPFPEAEPIYKSNGRSVEDTLVTRSPTLTRPKTPGPQDTKDETEDAETSNVETRALRNDGQPHGPKHKGGRSTGKTVEARDNRTLA